jgi:hypothetical protein
MTCMVEQGTLVTAGRKSWDGVSSDGGGAGVLSVCSISIGSWVLVLCVCVCVCLL